MDTEEESRNKVSKNKEGTNLIGSPTFTEIGNGRLRCIETGHEVVARDKEPYSRSKRCRLGLIDHALSQGKPPLNMFTQHRLSRSKLVCRLTGDTVNKSEEHIWKHINGRRFLNKLDQMVRGIGLNERAEKTRGGRSRGDKKGKDVTQIVYGIRDESGSDSEGPDFWMSSGSESSDEGITTVDGGGAGDDFEEISERTKRLSIEMGPSSFASRKKKGRKETESCPVSDYLLL
ncbi:PREDICTED: uncharacterized protein LOC104805360 [Tarenaya hassleriana]|uniref:uncharacterized protein LOC104805360 n=1 Tax=Tarenaya hassleriana TaxID=28532 RepID=UPI00053C9265|nr:PREDICTED: uncharacterized protein LOC104805360 [Tarenaya hassleriana]